MPRGRPPKPGTVEEKAAARRERVRLNVRALRERRKNDTALLNDTDEPSQLKLEWLNKDEYGVEDPQDDNESYVPRTISNYGSSSTSQRSNSTSSPSATGALFVVNQKNNAVVRFPPSINTKGPYATAIIAAVRQQFLPHSIYLPPAISKSTDKTWESDRFLWTPCAFWVTSAHTRAANQDSSLLKTQILAVGLLLKSFEHHDPSLRIASMELYRRALAGIRKTLEPLAAPQAKRPKDVVSLYLACHAAAMYELVQNSDLSATMHHLRGISTMFLHLGEAVDQDGQSTAWMLLQDFRLAEMGLCLKFRYTSFSSVATQRFEGTLGAKLQISKRSPTAFAAGNHSMLVTITDLADEIAVVMVQLDKIRPRWTRSDTPLKLRSLIKDLDGVFSAYDILYAQLTARYGSTFVTIDSDANDTGLGYFKFKNFDLGAAWCYSLMTKMYCVETTIEAVTLLLQVIKWTNAIPSPPESRKSDDSVKEVDAELLDENFLENKLSMARCCHQRLGVQLAKCLQYFLQTDKGITGQSLCIFVLDATSSMLDVEMARLDTDIQEAIVLQDPSSKLASLVRQQAELQIAQEMCRKMQDRAENYGMPSVYTAGPARNTANVYS